MICRTKAMLDERSSLPSIGWEDMIASFNSYLNDPQKQRDGMIASQLAAIARYCGDTVRARALYEKSKALWPESMNTWMELDFC